MHGNDVCRLLSPATRYFSMSQPVFPQEAGHLRPGLTCSFRVTFRPDALRNYSDQITVERPGAPAFIIPLSAGLRPGSLPSQPCPAALCLVLEYEQRTTWPVLRASTGLNLPE